LFRETIGNDIAFILELSIHGRFVQVPSVLFRYRARETWSTTDDDAKVFFGRHSRRWPIKPFIPLFFNHSQRLGASPIPLGTKVRLFGVLTAFELRRLILRAMIKIAGMCCPAPKRENLGRVIYRRWIQNPNVKIVSEDLFMTRVCKPQLGWWS
jgi:hypothetical protein